MYRDGKVYDEIVETIIQIYIDYDIKSFPVDEKKVCRMLGVSLLPYSYFNDRTKELLLKKSEFGFFVKGSKDKPPTIYYNDLRDNYGSVRFTIFHELKHYVYEDEDDGEDDLADYFARQFMCPTSYLLLKNIDTENEIMSFCGVSYEAAMYACSNIMNRRMNYGYKLFDYEIRLIEHLEPVLIEVYKRE